MVGLILVAVDACLEAGTQCQLLCKFLVVNEADH